MKVAVFMNPSAGSANTVSRDAVQILFAEAGMSANVYCLPDGEGAHILQQPWQAGVDAIVAAGGDGTVSTVAQKVAGSGIPLGVLPIGTANHFAKDLGIPLDLSEAVRCIAEASPEPVDAGEVNGRLFINNSSIGAYPQIVVERETKRKLGIPKWLGNVIGLCKVLRRWPLLFVKLELDGRSFTRITPFVFVGNNDYAFNPRNERYRNELQRGQLCVFTIQARNFWGLVRLFWLSLRNKLKDAEDFQSHLARELTIYPHRKHLRVAIDGEICRLETPLRYRARPGELLVFTPSRAVVDEGNRAHLGPALRS